ncbi:MAG: hypothetical protein LBK59_11345 [Bifidobacteriaceae bacterium]|jgi:hypothetical protein|nr:hypothetical protein [Bifidobacteriaceae bacterium]
MRDAFPEAAIDATGLNPEEYPSKDLDDRLVIGAAHRSPASLIITRNLADFPSGTLKRYGMEAQTADHLLLDLLTSNPDHVIAVLGEMQSDTKNPPLTMNEMLKNLDALVYLASLPPSERGWRRTVRSSTTWRKGTLSSNSTRWYCLTWMSGTTRDRLAEIRQTHSRLAGRHCATSV